MADSADASHQQSTTSASRRWLAPLGFLLVTITFWTWHVADRELISSWSPSLAAFVPSAKQPIALDFHLEHMPMTTAAFGRLADGELPLWNPYQLCGVPLLAVPYVGAFYPPNAIYTWSVHLGTEVLFIAHTVVGLLALWFLCLRLGCSRTGSAVAALTFAGSGYLEFRLHQPSLLHALHFTPLVLLAIDRILDRQRWGISGLALATAGILLNGAAEILVHALYLGALFTLVRSLQHVRKVGSAETLKRAALVLAGVIAGIALGSAQTLPTLELSSASFSEPLTLAQVAGTGSIRPYNFALGAFTGKINNVGIVAIVLLPLAVCRRSERSTAVLFLLTAFLSMQLVFGGTVFAWYYETPLGAMFRRPLKFLDIYVLSQAILLGISITNLQHLATAHRRAILGSVRWLACLLIGGVAAGWLFRQDMPTTHLAASLVLLLILPAMVQRFRPVVILALCLVQLASLGPSMRPKTSRLNRAPQAFTAQAPLFDSLRPTLGHQRIYVAPKFIFHLSLTIKSPIVYRVRSTLAHERLIPERYSDFFDAVLSRPRRELFRGVYRLEQDSRFELMDMIGTRYYIVPKTKPGAEHPFQTSSGFREIANDWRLGVFERPSAEPRAWVVHRGLLAENAEAALTRVVSGEFAARDEVVLEQQDAPLIAAGLGRDESDAVTFVDDSPEHVSLDVTTSSAGYLVLADYPYPGWRATVNDEPVPLYTANYVMRAVVVPAGTSRVEFHYVPQSVIYGLAISGVTALGLIAGCVVASRRARTDSRRR